MIKLISIALSVGIVLYVCFYIPKQLKRGRGARFRYLVFSVLAFVLAFVLLRAF